MRIALFALITLLIPSLAAAEDGPAEIANKVEQFYKEKPNVGAKFTQKVQKPGRRRQLTKSGKVWFKRPGKMRWDYSKPEKVYYVSDGSVLWSYQPEDNLVTKLDVKSSELYHQSRYLFGQGNLSEDFKLGRGEAGKDELKDLFPLKLEPKTSSRNFKTLTLYVNAETGEIKRTVLVDPYDNTSTITFEKVSFKPREDKTFEFTPPSGAIIKNLSKQGKAAKAPASDTKKPAPPAPPLKSPEQK